jgi:cytochrome c553
VPSTRLFRPLLSLWLIGSAWACPAAPLLAQTVTAAQAAPDTLAERVRGCTACHGVHGEGSGNDYFPRLAGKPAEYLYHQLVNFRDGRRTYPAMNFLLSYLDDPYLREIAGYFAAQRPAYPAPTPTDLPLSTLQRGRQLALHGDPARGLPACAACHGAGLNGMQPAIPGLLGLHVDYLSAQLGAFRSGTRRAQAPDCMQQVAGKLSDEDVSALTAWLAAQPVPAQAAPAPAGSLVLPLACGSEPQPGGAGG